MTPGGFNPHTEIEMQIHNDEMSKCKQPIFNQGAGGCALDFVTGGCV